MAVAAAPRAFLPQGRTQPAAGEMGPRLRQLRELRRVPLQELVARLADLRSDEASPVRKVVAEMIGEVGSKKMVYIPDMMPYLLDLLDDETPAVARQAVKTGTNLFAKVLQQLVIQGLFSSGGIDDSLKLSWEWMLKLKSAVSLLAFQSTSNEGVRLLAIKFVEKTVLMHTPDPNITSDPPNQATEDMGFNIAWLRGGHPLLNVGDLAMEASQSLGQLLEQLKSPKISSLSTSMIIVFVSSLSAIAQRRPSFYGRILPVLLSLDPTNAIIKVQVPGAFHALKSAFDACLKCTHSSAEPWRARLLEAQNIINQGDSIEHNANAGRSVEETSNKAESLPLTETSTDNSNKRSLADDMNNILEDDGHSSKRVRQSHDAEEHSEEARNIEVASIDSSSNPPAPARTGNSEAVYQLISMFAALAAQGDRAAGSLQILSSSIAADLLAEVVMVNMQHLPVSRPEVDKQQPPSTSQSSQSSNPISGRFPLLESLLKTIKEADQDEVPPVNDSTLVTSSAGDVAPVIASSAVPTATNPPKEENSDSSAVPLDMEIVEAKVPSADATGLSIEIQESSETSHASTEPQGTQEHSGSFISSLPADNSSVGVSLAQSSETRSPTSSTIEGSQSQFSSLNSLTSQHVLPKLVVTNIDLTDEAKDLLQKEAFLRILERDKQEESSGSNTRLPLLSHLGVEFPLELDPWELLQKHVLSDYVNNEGHELTLCILNRLYREAEQDQDFLSSRTATSVYESFVLTVAENLRDMFPASDKSLGKLLCEMPYLSDGVLKLLESLCSPGNNEKQDKDLQSGDRVTQGLSAVWNLIMLRPSNRDRCLEIALQSSINRLDEVRMKAIRLVANKLFPMASISKRIEDFANEKLDSVLEVIPATESASAAEMATSEVHEDGGLENSASVAEAQTLMSLYFALCTKKHSLLRRVFAIYGSLPQSAKQAVHRQVPILIRTIRSSPDLLGIISDPPADSRDLLMQVLQTLTDGAVPSQDLISSIKNLYSKTKDAEFLFSVMAHLTKDEVMSVFSNIVNLPMDKFQVALSRILQGSPQHGPSLDPSEILIAIHVIDPEKEGIPLKKVMDACAACFEQRTIFTQQVLAKALNQLVEQIPLPLLFMRTVMQAIGAFPALVDFVMEIMSRLVSKQIWKYPKLWVGFLKCAILTKPQSYGVLLQLPAPQLENALNKNPVLKAPLVEHASQPNVRSTLPS
ncbi:symplekin isoform X2 [Brachypodium distachyon]|uniref:symplekin isoform X2 n=1 Tax=Brachypodium distachyon TaxID=15368 RepID=UPI000D0C98F2|nr:symplekin isoform X2 [Brachypodium distachyon]|eukprot:XP_024312519.1 symplekin isoform X2 [Brachypodium distachyon]